MEWWLLDRGVRFQTDKVKQALAELIAKGLVIEQKRSDSKILYRVNQSRLEDIEKPFKLRDE